MSRKPISIKSVNGDLLRGFSWECEKPEGTFFIVTGMEEHSLRYDGFATYLNKFNFNVYCIDNYGQGENVIDEKDLGIVPRSAFSKTVRILDDLIKKYSIKDKPTVILGHSMGSFLIQDYIQRYSKHATHAIIMGSNGRNASLSYKFGYLLVRLICKLRGEKSTAKYLRHLVIGSYAKSVKHRRTDCDWLSYNENNVNKYIADPKSGRPSSNGFYRELLKGNHRLYKSKFLSKVSPNIKILISSGAEDPVGVKGKGPKNLYKMYKQLGVKSVSLKIYENMRHEVLNETNKEIVYKDIVDFIKQ